MLDMYHIEIMDVEEVVCSKRRDGIYLNCLHPQLMMLQYPSVLWGL